MEKISDDIKWMVSQFCQGELSEGEFEKKLKEIDNRHPHAGNIKVSIVCKNGRL